MRVGKGCAILAVALCACVQPTGVRTIRAADYTVVPRRLYVLHPAGLGLGDGFAETFRQRFEALARECGVATRFGAGVGLRGKALAAELEESQADALLTLALTGRQTGGLGGTHLAHFDVILMDVKADRAVWRGKFTLDCGGLETSIASRGKAFAGDVAKALMRDAILKECVATPDVR